MWVQVNGNQGYVYFTLFLLTVKFKSMYVLIRIQNEWVEEMLRGTTGPDIKNTEKSTFPKIWDLDLRLRDGLGESKALVIKAVFAPVLLTVKIKKMLVFDRLSSFTNNHQNGVCSMWGYRWEFRQWIQEKCLRGIAGLDTRNTKESKFPKLWASEFWIVVCSNIY